MEAAVRVDGDLELGTDGVDHRLQARHIRVTKSTFDLDAVKATTLALFCLACQIFGRASRRPVIDSDPVPHLLPEQPCRRHPEGFANDIEEGHLQRPVGRAHGDRQGVQVDLVHLHAGDGVDGVVHLRVGTPTVRLADADDAGVIRMHPDDVFGRLPEERQVLVEGVELGLVERIRRDRHHDLPLVDVGDFHLVISWRVVLP